MFRKDQKEEVIRLHREHWDVLAKNPCLTKEEALDEMEYLGPYPEFMCFACQWATDRAEGDGISYNGLRCSFSERCKYCLLDWPDENCSNFTGLFNKWHNSDSISERRALAEQIRDLPLKELKPGFDGIDVQDLGYAFRISATLNGECILQGYICDIMKDGSGIDLHDCVNDEVFQVEGSGDTIKLIP